MNTLLLNSLRQVIHKLNLGEALMEYFTNLDNNDYFEDISLSVISYK